MHHFAVSRPTPWGFLDEARVDPCGVVDLSGWSRRRLTATDAPTVRMDGEALTSDGFHRYPRPDVPPADGEPFQTGVVFRYRLLDERLDRCVSQLLIGLGDGALLDFACPLDLRPAPYGGLLDEDRVLGREHIYGFGPPMLTVSTEVAELCGIVGGRVLDFGCGSGALVGHLRDRGVDAHGLELDREPIRTSLHRGARPWITLYDGTFPAPYGPGAFDWVVSVEVLEHIPGPAAVIAEMARLTRSGLLLTVPDIGILPLGARHGLVPWHLLESTHVNFFTQKSLAACLAPHFRRVEFGRISPCRFNETPFHVSLVAVCTK